MSNNCLVKKLRAAVDNNNLYKLGDLVLKSEGSETDWILTCVVPGSFVIRAKGTVYVNPGAAVNHNNPGSPVSGSVTLTNPSSGRIGIYIPNNGDCAMIEDYYNKITGSISGYLSVEQVNYLTSLINAYIGDGFLSKLKAAKLANATLVNMSNELNYDTDIISYLQAAQACKQLYIKFYDRAITTGQIGASVSLVLSSIAFPYSSNRTGTIEDFVSSLVGRGKTSGTIKNITGTYQGTFTFGGVAVSANLNDIVWSPNSDPSKTDISFEGRVVTINNPA